jgi:cation diffusion facilitator CzcD-associated flavoprotein CzcO
MYDSAHFISSRHESGYLNHPMPESYPDYPNHRQILAYVRDVAAASGVTEHVRLGTGVDHAEQSADGRCASGCTSGSGWPTADELQQSHAH